MLYGINYDTRTMSGRKMAPATSQPLECQSCGARVSELFPCKWDTRLMVGACCIVADDESADVPACPVALLAA
jgi:hypothetical protein